MPGFLSRLIGRKPREEPSPGAERDAAAEGVAPAEKAAGPERPREWIGVDLDGTLAYFTRWRGLEKIGKPVPNMVTRINDWMAQGYEVKIVTARASVPGGREAVRKWLEKHRLPPMEVTHSKDLYMVELWDDRAIQVVTNRGQPALSPSVLARPRAPLLEAAFPHENRGTLDPDPPAEEPQEDGDEGAKPGGTA